MPYRHAWLFIVALIAATGFAFWRSYFSILPTAPIGFHIHGITATLWLLLLLAQGWTPHHGRIALHRRLGLAVFVAVPLFAAGSMAVVWTMAKAKVGGSPFYALWGVPLSFIDLLALAAFLYAAGMALRHRRNVRLHAGYTLSTALPLVSPVLGRVFNQTVPGITIHGPQDFPVFGWGVQLANLVTGLIALWLWRRDPRHGRPWAVALAVVAIQIAGFHWLSAVRTGDAAYAMVAALPLPVAMAAGLAAGIAALVMGWGRPAARARATAA